MDDERTDHLLLGLIRESDGVAAVHVPGRPALPRSMVAMKRWLMHSHLCGRVWAAGYGVRGISGPEAAIRAWPSGP